MMRIIATVIAYFRVHLAAKLTINMNKNMVSLMSDAYICYTV